MSPPNRAITTELWNFCTPPGWRDYEEFIVTQYLNGTSSIELSRIMGISPGPIRRELRRLGVIIRPRGCCVWNPEVRKRISESVKAYYNTRY
jgi:hypothetical protein